MKTLAIVFGIIILFLIIFIGLFMLKETNSEAYEYLKQDCESNGGTLWTYSGCNKIPLVESNCEFDGGYVCHLPNGTKYQKEINAIN